MADQDLEAAAATAWAEALGCDRQLLAEPGWHMVPGGAGLRDRNAVYMAGMGAAVLVYCPGRLRPRAAAVLASTPPGHLFTAGTCATIAGVEEVQVLGPSWHGFTDAGHFTPAVPGVGRLLDRDDRLLAGLRQACGGRHGPRAGSPTRTACCTGSNKTAAWPRQAISPRSAGTQPMSACSPTRPPAAAASPSRSLSR